MSDNIEYINKAIEKIENRFLADSLDIISQYIQGAANQDAHAVYDNIRNNYIFMLDYMQRGTRDPERDDLYNRLLKETFSVLMDLSVDCHIAEQSAFMDAYNITKNQLKISSAAEIRNNLEDFVSSVAITDLNSGPDKNDRLEKLYAEHQNYMSLLFKKIMIAKHWTYNESADMQALLLSPTVESQDRQLIISALMLNLLEFFDIRKFLLLVNVYTKTDDEYIRQRALLGWALTMRPSADKIFPEQRDAIDRLIQDKDICIELLELQEQLIYCEDTDRYTDKIQKEIIPDLIKNNNNLSITPFGIEEKEDPMLEIFDPGASDRAMDNVEKSMGKMMDMMKQGSDIYFGGFSQMKRYPFFEDITNWFCPFYIQHPGLSHISYECKSSLLLENLMHSGPFCDSDKYSFALTIDKIFNSLPSNVKEMLGNSYAFGQTFPEEELAKPIYIRRMYLQNVYRFFRLYSRKENFIDVFGMNVKKTGEYNCDHRSLFLLSTLFDRSKLSDVYNDFAKFMSSHKKNIDVDIIFRDSTDKNINSVYLKLKGAEYYLSGEWNKAWECFEKALAVEPDDERTLVRLGRTYLKGENFEKAEILYKNLLLKYPDKNSFEIKYIVCLSNNHKHEEALQRLYKLNYELPNDRNVIRLLAWNTLYTNQLDKSNQYYSKLISEPSNSIQDYVYAGYCSWFLGNIEEAKERFICIFDNDSMQASLRDKLLRSFFAHDSELIKNHGISNFEMEIMSDLVRGLS